MNALSFIKGDNICNFFNNILEPISQFQPNLEQGIIWWMEFKLFNQFSKGR